MLVRVRAARLSHTPACRAAKARELSEEDRKAKKQGALSDAQVEALEEAGVAWDPLAAVWERMHGLLLAFKEREGHCDVPAKHEEQGAKLGSWLGHQRTAYKRGTLEARRVQILEDCGVTWTIR